jgi:TusE/DsrC/DsvC family sulfur relay protein
MELTMDATSEAVPSSVEARLDALTAQVAALVRQRDATAELWTEFSPVVREMLRVGGERLARLEQRGYFDFGRELLTVVDQVVTHYSPEDVRALAGQVVNIVDTVRRLTQPGVMAAAGEAGVAVARAGEAEPKGLLGMLKASRDEEVKRGMAVLLEVVRHVGRAAGGAVTPAEAATPPTHRALARLAPSGRRTAGEPARAVAPRTARPAVGAPARNTSAAPAKSAPARPLPDVGVALTADGFLADAGAWTPTLARALAAYEGVEPLTEQHLAVVAHARELYTAQGASPNVRRLALSTGLGTARLYELFPRAPAKTVARIAGIPKPVGCI